MLFNSPLFLLVFLPITLAGFYAVGHWRGGHYAVAFLVLASFVFYAYSSAFNFIVFVASVTVNFFLGAIIAERRWSSSALLVCGVILNLGLIGYFKYSGLLVTTANDIFSASFAVPHVLLPVGISFYTFQQISFLADTRLTERSERSLIHYALFVSFFPQLIAGPIVHPREVLPQFARPAMGRFNWEDLAIGVTFLCFGLFKKVILADGIAEFSTPIFDATHQGHAPSLISAWGAAFAYSFQIYFDFSGYSDMAVGLGRMFGIRLPFNFNSPYKATNIIDFWRRWHMTLSRFLRNYVYIPLGGNRRGPARRHVNLMLTMLIGGLWHGANWTFVAWGGLHGLYLMINHVWRSVRGDRPSTLVGRWIARGTTLIAIVVAWVFFRSESFAAASLMLEAMVGHHGLFPAAAPAQAQWVSDLFSAFGVSVQPGVPAWCVLLFTWCVVLGALVWAMPNTQEFILGYRWAPGLPLAWRPSKAWGTALGLGFGCAVAYYVISLNRVSEFIYFIF